MNVFRHGFELFFFNVIGSSSVFFASLFFLNWKLFARLFFNVTNINLYICDFNALQMVRWYLDDDDEDDDYEEEHEVDVLKPERLLHRTDRGAGWNHVQQLMHGSDQQCYDILRMNQRTFQDLCKMLAT